MPAPPERLTRSADVTGVLRRGRSRSGTLLAVHVRPRDDEEGHASASPARFPAVASRKVGGAVRRNRAKRLLRESARGIAWRDGTDVVLIARAPCADSDLQRVREELERLARQLEAVVA